MLKCIEPLVNEIQSQWAKKQYDVSSFPEIATKAVKNNFAQISAAEHTFTELFWGKDEHFPRQMYQGNSFGQPPLTLYSDPNGRFVIDVYYWLAADTNIHDHRFCGAFGVLRGKSLNCTYDFQTREIIQSDCHVGDLRARMPNFLQEGDVVTIAPGDKFIHRVWHLAFPTVSFCVRTVIPNPNQDYQFNYSSQLRTGHHGRNIRMSKFFDFHSMLLRTKDPRQPEIFRQMFVSSPPALAYWLLEKNFPQHANVELMEELVEEYKQKWGSWAQVMAESIKSSIPIQRVKYDSLTKVEHKFLIALLVSCTKKSELSALVKYAYPSSNSEDLIISWLSEVVNEDRLGIRVPDVCYPIISEILTGKSPEEAIRHAETLLDDEIDDKYNQLSNLVKSMKGYGLLSPLFA